MAELCDHWAITAHSVPICSPMKPVSCLAASQKDWLDYILGYDGCACEHNLHEITLIKNFLSNSSVACYLSKKKVS